MDKNLLLPREKYEEERKKYGESPFTFEIEKDGQVLFYFGANHSHDPANHQYPILKEYWEKFLFKSEGKEKIVLVESELRKLEENLDTAIRRGSEGSFITFLAHEESIFVACPDIEIEDLSNDSQEVSKEEALLYRFINVADNYKRTAKNISFEEFLENWCKDKKQNHFWNRIEISVNSMKNLYKKVLGKEFDENDDLNSLVNPNKIGTRINEISQILTDTRELKIVSEIERYWKEGKSIFVVFGSGHLIIQKPALEKLCT